MSDNVTEFSSNDSFLFARSKEAKGYMLVTCCNDGNARFIAEVDKCNAQEIMAMLGTLGAVKRYGLDTAINLPEWSKPKEEKNE